MTTTKKTIARFVAVLALGTLAACGNGNHNGSPDLAMAGADMAPSCVMNPMTSEELLNACTTAQTGDPTKDAPYFPSLAPNGALPPLP
ncbi:MAG: hypothetical protein ACXVDD_09035 [Polyangia bacterium]